MFAVIDSGTTNTRIYLADDRCRIIASRESRAGGRDVSLAGKSDALRRTIEEMYCQLLSDAGVSGEDVAFITASGMITSEIGLIELPHLVAPAGLRELAAGVYVCEDPAVLDLGRPVHFIRGVKNSAAEELSYAALLDMDFMRGEEIQYPGILKHLGEEGPCNVITLSSHTKICHMDEAGRIAFSQTTISGQLYEALLERTFIGKSVAGAQGEPEDPEMIVDAAMRFTEEAGLLHILMVPRFMEVLMHTDAAQRRLFVDAALAADDCRTFAHMRRAGRLTSRFIIYGKAARCRLYERVLRRTDPGCSVTLLTDPQEIAACSVRGAWEIMKEREILQHV